MTHKEFSRQNAAQKDEANDNPSVDDDVNRREQQPPQQALRDSSENKIEAPSYSPSDDFAKKMSPEKNESSSS